MNRCLVSAVLGVLFAMSTACSTVTTCAGVGLAGIVADVRQPSGATAMPGSLIVAVDGSYADTVGPVVPAYLGGPDSATAWMAMNRGGNYMVTVTKPGWTTDTRRVNVPGGSCGYVETQKVRLQISLCVAVQPRSVRFGFCNSGAQAVAYVDADADKSKDVTWRSADTTVATVSSKGIIAVKSHGTAKVFAGSVADPRVEGVVSVQVDPVC